MSYHQVSKISLSPEVIDCIVFWTKDPSKIVDRLHLLEDYLYYFHVTINGYDRRIERFLPPKETIVASFLRLSKEIGKRRVIWRYDPIILNSELSIDYHTEKFRQLARQLESHTDKCIISFVDAYEKTVRNTSGFDVSEMTTEQMNEIAGCLAEASKDHGISLETCSEQIDLEGLGIRHASCIDKALISELSGHSIIAKEDRQRKGCLCATCIDIGSYNTCKHGCIYCYATYSDKSVQNNQNRHNMYSPLLVGEVEKLDKMTDRKMVSYKNGQLSFLREESIRHCE